MFLGLGGVYVLISSFDDDDDDDFNDGINNNFKLENIKLVN